VFRMRREALRAWALLYGCAVGGDQQQPIGEHAVDHALTLRWTPRAPAPVSVRADVAGPGQCDRRTTCGVPRRSCRYAVSQGENARAQGPSCRLGGGSLGVLLAPCWSSCWAPAWALALGARLPQLARRFATASA
jgi:hypothetical protein